MVNSLFNENNLTTLNRMPDNFLDGIICSPPYNISGERKDCYYNTGYSENDNLTEEDYIKLRIKEFEEFERVLKNKGVIAYNISYHKENPILPFLLLSEIHKRTNLTLADMISWKKKSSIPFQTSPTKLSRIVEPIFIIVHKDFLHTFKANKEISKINERTGQKFYKNYYNIIEAKNNDGVKTKLKATFSTDLVEKIMNIYFPEASIIYDPFMGIGTTAKACVLNKRKFIGSEMIREFFEDSIKQLKELKL